MLYSDYPLDKIENLLENPEAEAINLNSNKAYALIARPENTILTFWINADDWLFIDSLQQKLNLAQAVQKTCEQHPDFNLTQSLQWILQNKLIASAKVTPSC
jgi:hypothetical protein